MVTIATYLNILTGEFLDTNLENVKQPKQYVKNEDMLFFKTYMLFKYKDKTYIPKSYSDYRRFLDYFKFFENRPDVDMYLNKETLSFFEEVELEQESDAHIYQQIMLLEGISNMAIFKFQIIEREGVVYFINPLPLDKTIYESNDTIFYLDSPSTYNLICGLLADNLIVYTTTNRLTNLTEEDIFSTQKIEETENEDFISTVYLENKYTIQLEQFLTQNIVTKFRDMDSTYFKFNLLQSYFLSKNIHLDMFESDVEILYSNIVNILDDVEEDTLSKLEDFITLKNKIQTYINIEELYTEAKEILGTNQIIEEEKENYLTNIKETLLTLAN